MPAALDADLERLNLKELRVEACRRSFARKKLSAFLRYRFMQERRPLMWNWHLDYLCDLLEAVTIRQEVVRFMIINMPFRMLKSEVIGQSWQAWMIGRENTARSSLLSAGAGDDLATRDSTKTRDMLEADWYQRLFPGIRLVKKLEQHWNTNGGAERIAKGRGAVIVGRGADHLLWDDLITPKEVSSEKVRQDTNFWLGDTFRSRLNDQITGTITGIQQRLHEEDPSGYLLTKMKNPDADQYYHVVIPNEAPQRTVVQFGNKIYAVREKGDLLHEARFDRKATKAFWASNPISSAGQLQQQPNRTEGGELKTAWLRFIDKPVEQIARENGLKPSFYIDLASKKKQLQKDNPDFSAIAVMARDRWDRIHLLEVWRAQERGDVVVRQIIAMRKRWAKLGSMGRIKAEAGALANSLDGTFVEVMRNLQEGGFIIEPLKVPGDKIERAQPLRYLAREGRLYLPQGAPWLPEFELEWRSFPNAGGIIHDDQIDAVAYGALDLENLAKGKPQPEHHAIKGEITGRHLEEIAERKRQLESKREDAADNGTWWR